MTAYDNRDSWGGLAKKVGGAVDHGDLVLLQQEADAARQLLGDLARPLHHRRQVEFYVVGGETELAEVVQQMVDLGRAQQRLGRDAAPVQADAAEIGFLDNRSLEAKLRRADGGDVAAGAGADDDDVEGCVGHIGSVQFRQSLCGSRCVSR